MTTIAYREGVMASDEVASCSDEISFGVEKVGRTEKYLFGYAGRFSSMRPAYKWISDLEAKGVSPQDFYLHREALLCDDDGHVILADREGRVWDIELDGQALRLRSAFTAIGTGHRFAKGAMAFGASAREAVEIATKFDAYSDGKVSTWTFDMPIHCPNEMEDK